ncbi:hypothetical protein RINTHM_14930 [Richelia intracellularis HM01]|nr:hypothetical protein RINTHM_14930 [Richelia intracellularis HM01]
MITYNYCLGSKSLVNKKVYLAFSKTPKVNNQIPIVEFF